MKILYDYQMFSIQKFGGITRYFCELMKNLPPEHKYHLSLLFSENNYIKENYDVFKKKNILPDKSFKGKHFLQEGLFAINHYYSTLCISSNNFDLFHPTFYDNYFLKELKKPFIITVHDLILFKYNNLYYKSEARRLQMENIIKKANRIIAISDNTKNDIIEILKIDPEKIDVVYHGYNKPSTRSNINYYGKYILFVGQRSLHKNFKTFIEAVSKILNKEKDIKLVCIGPPFSDEEIVILSRLNISNQTIAINVDDNLLNSFYSNALVFVYPSLYEGFGMPILEAFANNCPICLSNTSCFPEIAGNAGVYFDPSDYKSILSAIEKVIYDNDLAKEMILAGQIRLTLFSWEKAINETIESYKKTVLNSN